MLSFHLAKAFKLESDFGRLILTPICDKEPKDAENGAFKAGSSSNILTIITQMNTAVNSFYSMEVL